VIAVLLPTLAGGAVRWEAMTRRELNSDEVWTATNVEQAKDWRLWKVVHNKALLSYFPIYAMHRLAPPLDRVTLRLPNAIAGTLAVAAMGWLAWCLARHGWRANVGSSAWIGFIFLCAWFLAFHPIHLRYGVHARYYGYYTLFFALTLGALCRAGQATSLPRAIAWFVAAAAALVLAAWSHLFTLTFIPGMAILFGLVATRLLWRGWSAAVSRRWLAIPLGLGWFSVATLVAFIFIKAPGLTKQADYEVRGVVKGWGFFPYWSDIYFWLPRYSGLVGVLTVLVGAALLLAFCRRAWPAVVAGPLSLLLGWRLVAAMSPMKAVEAQYMLPGLILCIPLAVAGLWLPIVLLTAPLARPWRDTLRTVAATALAASWLLWVWPARAVPLPTDFDPGEPLELLATNLPGDAVVHVFSEGSATYLRRQIDHEYFGTASGTPPPGDRRQPPLRLAVLSSEAQAMSLLEDALTTISRPLVLMGDHTFARVDRKLMPLLGHRAGIIPFHNNVLIMTPNAQDIPLQGMATGAKAEGDWLIASIDFPIAASGVFQPVLMPSNAGMLDAKGVENLRRILAAENADAVANAVLASELRVPGQEAFVAARRVENASAGTSRELLLGEFPQCRLERGVNSIAMRLPGHTALEGWSLAFFPVAEAAQSPGSEAHLPMLLHATPPSTRVQYLQTVPRFHPLPPSAARVGLASSLVVAAGARFYVPLAIQVYFGPADVGEWEFGVAGITSLQPRGIYSLTANGSEIAQVEYLPGEWSLPRAKLKIDKPGIYLLGVRPKYMEGRPAEAILPMHLAGPDMFDELTLTRMP